MKKPMQKYAFNSCYATYREQKFHHFAFFITKAPKWGFCYILKTLYATISIFLNLQLSTTMFR